MFSTWEVGASVHVLSAGRVMSALKYAKEHQLTVWSSVPSLVGMLRQIKALSPNALPNLRLSVFAGEPLPSSIASVWKTVAPNTVVENLYGPTEATVYCLRQTADEPPSLTPGRDFFAIGNPLPGCEAAIVDADNHFVARGVTGELAIAGPQLADGYLNAPELTQARFPVIDGKRWYLTGDLAMQDADGIFHCLGRIDNQVKVLGNRVELEEVDAHLRLIADTSVAATVAWPVVDGSVQGLVAFVGANSEGAIDSEQIIASLKAKLPAYMVPSRVHALADMPFNPSGKVDRRALRRLLEDGAL
jgi:acyl-coenzyme A synthetase/AMP-(fatty) acid ligase